MPLGLATNSLLTLLLSEVLVFQEYAAHFFFLFWQFKIGSLLCSPGYKELGLDQVILELSDLPASAYLALGTKALTSTPSSFYLLLESKRSPSTMVMCSTYVPYVYIFVLV